MAHIDLSEDGILEKFDQLIASGNIYYDEKSELVPYTDRGFKFLFYVAPVLNKKVAILTEPGVPKANDRPAAKQPKYQPGSDISVEGFEICAVGETHTLAANKFCYTRPLMLLLTNDGFKRQYHPLETADLVASWALVEQMPGTDLLVFYNCGEPGGYSRLHRHVQVMLYPKDFVIFLDDENLDPATVPFLHYRRALPVGGDDEKKVTGEMLAGLYADMLVEAEAESTWRYDGLGTDIPHNVILTRRFIAVIPRQKAVHHEVSTNALGMLGMVLVPSRENMEDWIRRGPFDLLTVFGIPKKSG